MVDHFLRSKKKELKKSKILKLSREVNTFLEQYPWPGNVRELENLIESLYVFCEDEVTLPDIPERFKTVSEEDSLLLEDMEKLHIQKVLNLKKGNQRQTQIALGIKSINTLRKKIQDYRIIIDS